MDRSSIFKQLGVGLKFDLKRFGNDARRLNVIQSSSETSPPPVSSNPALVNGNVSDNSGVSKSKKKRKRKASTSLPDTEAMETAAKRERTTSASSEPAVDDAEMNGDIDLMTGVSAASKAPLDEDGTKKKKKKKKKKKNKDGSSAAASAAMKREEEVNALRNSLKIHVKGTDIPDPLTTFEEMKEKLDLNETLLGNLKNFEYDKPTPIQMQSVPLMANGYDSC